MFQHHLDGMINKIVDALDETFPDGIIDDTVHLEEAIRSGLNEYWDGSIVGSVWCIDDVIENARQHGLEVSEKQAKAVLDLALHKHDAEIGINWDVLLIHTEGVLAEWNSES
jgi:hypothetical protein